MLAVAENMIKKKKEKMKLYRLIIVVLILFSNSIVAQKNIEWKKVVLSVRHYKRVPDNSIKISIQKSKRNKTSVDVSIMSINPAPDWFNSKDEGMVKKKEVQKKDTLFTISRDKYSKIIESIKRIDTQSLYNNLPGFGVDGYDCSLEFGNNFNSMTYKIFYPTSNT